MTELPLPSLFLVTSNYLFQIDDESALTYSKFIIIPFIKVFPTQQIIEKYATNSFTNAFAYYILNFDKNNLFDIQSKELDDIFISLELYNLLAQLNFQKYIFNSFKQSPNSKLDLNELVMDDVIYKMVRMFAGKIKFNKYNDRHLQNTIYWFLRFNRFYSTEFEDNILHNFQYLHDKKFMLEYSNFGLEKKINQLKQSDKEKADASGSNEFLSLLQDDLAASNYELYILHSLIVKFNINRDSNNSKLDQFLTYDEILNQLKYHPETYNPNFDYKTILKKHDLLFSVDDPILNSPKLFYNPSQMTYFTWKLDTCEKKLLEVSDLREILLSFHDKSTDVETYKYNGDEYKIPHILNIFNNSYEYHSLVRNMSALTLAKILKTSDREPVKFVPYIFKEKLTQYPISPTSCS